MSMGGPAAGWHLMSSFRRDSSVTTAQGHKERSSMKELNRIRPRPSHLITYQGHALLITGLKGVIGGGIVNETLDLL